MFNLIAYICQFCQLRLVTAYNFFTLLGCHGNEIKEDVHGGREA